MLWIENVGFVGLYSVGADIKISLFSNCCNLQMLDLSGCNKLMRIDGEAFYSCSSLKTVDLSCCSALENIDGFGFCENLTSINMEGCTALT